jgi:cephalosporin-C deacetylase-like acetyl esterase
MPLKYKHGQCLLQFVMHGNSAEDKTTLFILANCNSDQADVYCIDFVAFMENPNKGWQIIAEEHRKSHPEIVQYSLIFE